MKKLVFIFLLSGIVFFGCKQSEEKLTDSILSDIEKQIEKNADVDIDLKRPSKSKPNKATGKIVYNGETIVNKDDFQANITISKNALLVDLSHNGYVIGVSVKVPDNYEQRPLKGKFTLSSSNNEYFATMLTGIPEEGQKNKFREAPKVYEGELTVLKLTEDEVILEIVGNGGLLVDMHKKEKWQPITVTIMCKNPNIVAVGVEKETIYF
ncbi:hypothetical protein QRD02_06525 [Aequorivita sp. SDUM287046]|uniref:Lipoprotein n=1 Tax=Aequorivita aurantiaca TaxID=3053356 RepID=A0ABT8DFB4_9FLAO|nr:hypothetical protein [Aequorivita aurantiaca]MDN3724031.1 hypothetical protein [Aequorivita aurantiaca]